MGGPCQPYITGDQIKNYPNVCAVPSSEEGPDFAALAVDASAVIYTLLGMQFPGICRATVRPVWREMDASTATLLGSVRGGWPGCGGDVIPLHNPIIVNDTNPIVVKINGATVTDYYVRDHYKLVRGDGKSWPTINRLHLADTEDGTFSITYSFGYAAPGAVVRAALALGVEYAREDTADPRGKLPPGTKGVSRSGQNINIDAEVERVRQAGSALPAIAAVMGTFNPTNSRLPSLIYSPDHEWDLAIVS